jgi:NTP pyrophosphatase (non-canonical NTP hydrolase)
MNQDILNEIEYACNKFPEWPTDPIHAVTILAEEVGELQKAILQETYLPGIEGHSSQRVYDEALQVAAMALRFLTAFDNYVYEPSGQVTVTKIQILEMIEA